MISQSDLVTSPIWGPRPDFCYYQTVEGVLTWEPSLTREQVCHFQLLLALTNTVILGTKSCRTDDHYWFRFEIPPAWKARFPFLYPPGTGWPSYNPRHWVPFPSPPMICRAMVEVFEPSSIWVTGQNQLTLPQPQLIYDWRFTGNQFILASSLLKLLTGVSPPPQLNACVQSLYNILPDERMSLPLMNIVTRFICTWQQ
jgi:hypothetical protein